ncbi:DUF1653 domain-containing protein [Anaerolentibacter hominis]|uniref:DUF1653 domain-containing protein n=1 Tax=Anaerolentibacter hominis TaxID=3079009 RepID=UPI0031B84B3E
MERQIPRPGEVYRHFKNKLYQIMTIAEHSETGETLIIYQALYPPFSVYARPLSMFMEPVDREKYPGVKARYRFSRIDKDELKPWDQTLKTGQKVEPSGEPASTVQVDTEEREDIDPVLLAFLETDDLKEKREILQNRMKEPYDEKILNAMAASLEVEISDSAEETFRQIKRNLDIRNRYEIRRRDRE